MVYCDPIYTTQAREQFDRYNSQLFSWDEQIRLSEGGLVMGVSPRSDEDTWAIESAWKGHGEHVYL